MSVTRRQIIEAGAAGVGAAVLTGCGVATSRLTQPALPAHLDATPTGPSDPARRLLNRAAFGPRPGDLARVRQMGVEAYLEEQLQAGAAPTGWAPTGHDTPAAEWRVAGLDTLQMDSADLLDVPKEDVQRELQQAAVVRAVYSHWQLREVMVDFWDDHFNVSQTKGDSAFYRTPYDVDAIRRHALGNFRHLLGASARSPAMLYYLDNARNVRGVANENYARELMELHTLGVDGGYTQRDVQEVARCFTGWTLKEHLGAGATSARDFFRSQVYEFRPDQHDTGDKRVLGRTIAGRAGPSGEREGEEMLDLLAAHPSAAHFLAKKLCRRFVADEPAEPLVARVAAEFLRSRGGVPAILRAIFASDEFRSGSGVKMKRPFDFVISALRGLNADTDGAGPLQHLAWMGQLPYHWAMPNGYPDRVTAWSSSLLARWNFAASLVAGQVGGTAVDLPALVRAAGIAPVDALAGVLIGCALPADRRALLARSVSAVPEPAGLQQAAASLLASPEFQWR
jgi:uncharacterized protein (DUF1800 family)